MEISKRSTIILDSTRESRITDVMLYNDRAQITRLYNLSSVAAGQTELKITNLPNLINQDSVRYCITNPSQNVCLMLITASNVNAVWSVGVVQRSFEM